jgi:hypothetical protein
VGSHYVHFVESLRAIGALSHAVRNAVFDTVVAEEMAAGLKNGILKILPTDGAECKSLDGLAMSLEP